MKNAVKNVGQKFFPECQAMGLVVERGHFRADHDFSMGEGEDISGGGVGKVGIVQTATFAG
jgi:hypothetical protein